jgi:hypothetical protein
MSRTLAKILILLLVPALALACVSKKKPKNKEPSADLSQYVVAEAPSGIKKVGTSFDGKVTLVGYDMKVKSGGLEPGDKVKYSLYWKVDQELGQSGWKLFTHVLNEKDKRILNIDGVGPLRDYNKSKNQALPPSDWKVGKVYVDEQTFTVPKSASGQRIRVVTGIWKGRDRLKVTKGPNAGDDRALITTLSIGGKAKDEKEKAEPVPELRLDRLAKGERIKIDGKLDEAAWKAAPTTGAFVNPSSGKPDPKASVQGSAKLLWDETNLYVGFTVEDKTLTGGFDKKAKDPHLWTKDTVELMVDPDGDGDNKDYYEIQVNPQNLVFDSRFDAYNKPNGGKDGPFGHEDWSAKLESAVALDGTLDKNDDEDKGYTVELKVPFKSFDKAKTVPPTLGDRWRVNLYAMQDNGGVSWSPILGQGNFHKATRFGSVLFAEKGWEPQPAAAPSGTAPSAGASASATAEDVKDAIERMKRKTKEATAPGPTSTSPRASAPRPTPLPPPNPAPPAPIAPKAPSTP